LAQQPVGVLVRFSQPGTARIAEVDLNVSGRRETLALCKLRATVPRQGGHQPCRQLLNLTRQSAATLADLRASGEQYGLNRVVRLMAQARLQAHRKGRRLPGDTASRAEHHIPPNHLQPQFEADAPNQKWVADFTYIWTAEGWLYAAAVMDLYSRRIVGWSMSDTMQAKMVSDALLMALWRRGRPSSLMRHSDQGSQYTSEDFQELLKSQGITSSMSRRGECWDAPTESLWGRLKVDRLYDRRFATRGEATDDVIDWLMFYNHKRLHSTLGYVSPMTFEQRWFAAQQQEK
jgi:putative transposase